MPPAFATIKNTKEFNAVQFGPGNTFAILKTPPEFQLNEFAISGDGKLLAMGWGSGKIDLWDLQERKRVADFKSEVGAPGVIKFEADTNHLLVTGSGGKFSILEIPKGKKVRAFVIPLGKFKYDIQQVVLDPSGKWLAYADEESSKVLDLSSDPPKTIADLQDACSVSISPDGTELWTANRNQITAYSTSTWEVIGHWPLKSPPVATASVRLRTGISKDGARVVAVPSSTGLVIYRGPGMEGSNVTDKSTTTVAFAAASKTFVNLGAGLTFVNSEGTVSCKRSLQGWSDYDISEDGQWIAVAQTNTVSVWRMDDVLRDCEAGR
jgi:WD40 repeat protein